MKYWYELVMKALSETECSNMNFQASKIVRDNNSIFVHFSAFPVVGKHDVKEAFFSISSSWHVTKKQKQFALSALV